MSEQGTGMIKAEPTALATMAQTPGAIESIEKLGDWFHASDLFGCKKPQQGKVLALVCAITGENPMKIMAENMICFGRLTRKYEMMLSDLRKAGGDYTWIEDGENGEQATIEITWKGKSNSYTFSMEHARRAKLIKAGGGWETWPGNMLRSKAVRNSLQMFCPEILNGFLTPEDAEDIASEDAPVKAAEKAAASRKRKAEIAAENERAAAELAGGANTTTATPAADAGEVIDAEYTVSDETEANEPGATEPAPFEEPTAVEQAPAIPPATVEQLRRIEQLRNILGVTVEKYHGAIKGRYGVDRPEQMTFEQAEKLLAAFEEQHAKKLDAAAKQAKES